MGDSTGISWTDATWNPIRGCSRVSAGCVNCYAERVANRFSGPGKPYAGLINQHGRWNGTVRMVPKHLANPLRWQKPRRIFVNSMSDLFHESLTNEQIAAVFGVMAAAPQHTFQVLTKRATRMREWFKWVEEQASRRRDAAVVRYEDLRDMEVRLCIAWLDTHHVNRKHVTYPKWPLPNVWLGVSVEDQEATHRIEPLLRTPAAVRFLSCEPLIGPVDLSYASPNNRSLACDLDWVIAGCESGPGSRPCEVSWLRSLRDQCDAAGTAFFLKQATRLRGNDPESGDSHRIEVGAGSKDKGRGVIELPYLDGEQHAAFPGDDHG